MPISFRCPDGHKLTVPDALAGRKARCPKCRRKMYIPTDSNPEQIARPAMEDAGTAEALEASAIARGTPPTAEGDSAVLSHEPTSDTTDVAWEAMDAPRAAPAGPPTMIYRADPDQIQNVRLLSIVLVLAALFTAGPVIWHRNLLVAPDWVRLVLLIAVVQLAYACWLASVPDWVSLWVAMLVNALAATMYGAALALFLYTPVDSPLGLGLAEVSRRTAAGWCLCVVLITTMMTFACGRVAATWRWTDERRRRRQDLASTQA